MAEATWLPQEAAEDGGLTGEAALALRAEWGGFDACVVGPGLGHTGETQALVWACFPTWQRIWRDASSSTQTR